MKLLSHHKISQRSFAFNSLKRVSILAFLILPVILVINGCQKDELIKEIKKERISGFVQKGPFINGTQILMSELNSDLEQTGKLFSTEIVSNTGLFQINDIALTSNFVQFSGSGFYFDEVKGEASASQLTLFALSDITDLTSVNVNIMTHLERRRVEYLIGQNMSFAKAKETAQSEILAMFGFDNTEMEESENLDITVDNDANAILLAISVILQGNRSVAELTELLAGISGDLREDGVLNDESTMENLRISSLQLDLEQIRQNLETRYMELGLEASIPPFEDYVHTFLSVTAGEPTATTMNAINITTTKATLQAMVNPNSASTNVIFEYGLTEEYGNEIPAIQSPASAHRYVYVSAEIEDLQPGTTYFYRVKAENDHGVSNASTVEFKTLGDKPDAVADYAEPLLNSATLHGKVNPNMLTTSVTFEWGEGGSFQHSATANESPVNGSNDISVSVEISGLQANTEYQFRIKAENELGVTLSEERMFKTFNATVMDADGNIYHTVIIGEQEWMAKNLKTTKYNDGSDIPTGLSDAEWFDTSVGSYSVYPHHLVDGISSSDEMMSAYGVLYNYYALDDERGICPVGWRIPDKNDFDNLILFLDPNFAIGNSGWYYSILSRDMLASARTAPMLHPRWESPNSATNETGFSAVPAGRRDGQGYYDAFGSWAIWWSITDYGGEHPYTMRLLNSTNGIYIDEFKNSGNSVRCVKD